MSRYIEREKVLEAMQDNKYAKPENDFQRGVNASVDFILADIKHLPTADVVEVVRCKDCKRCCIEHRKKEKGKESIGVYVCNGIGVVDSTFYCACGERREE